MLQAVHRPDRTTILYSCYSSSNMLSSNSLLTSYTMTEGYKIFGVPTNSQFLVFILMKCRTRSAVSDKGKKHCKNAFYYTFDWFFKTLEYGGPSVGHIYAPLLSVEFMFIFTRQTHACVYVYKYIYACTFILYVCTCTQPQGVGELFASNWNCRFNILNYRLANGQYFVTDLPLPFPLLRLAASDRYIHTSNCAT